MTVGKCARSVGVEKPSFDLVSEERLTELGLSRNPDEILGAGKYQIPISDEFSSRMASIFTEIKAGY